MNPTPPYPLYIWVGLSLCTLKYDEQAAYMELTLMHLQIQPTFYIVCGNQATATIYRNKLAIENWEQLTLKSWIQGETRPNIAKHYGQDLFDVELQAWIAKWHGCQHDNTFC